MIKFCPLLSEEDPIGASGGTIDPLGTSAIAESLAERLVPGVRERHHRLRFTTAIGVTMAICESFEDQVASDGVSEPYLVFEWHVAEAFVRKLESEDLRGVPGSQKVRQAIEDDVPLSASRYLKNARATGFHGTYRVLAENLGIIQGERLAQLGYELICVWAREQHLEGFMSSSDSGAGRNVFKQLQESMKDGIRYGRVERSRTWEGWGLISRILSPSNIGVQEGKLITQVLRDDDKGYRKQVLDFLVSHDAYPIVSPAVISEKSFHEAFKEAAGTELSALLETIHTYERFSRLLADAFEDSLQIMTESRGRTQLSDICTLHSIEEGSRQIPELYAELLERLLPYEQSTRFQEKFSSFTDPMNKTEWTETLLNHHRSIQQQKPPDGKMPWYERLDDGSYIIRPEYRRSEGADHTGEYVHGYRTVPLWSFANDLGLLSL